MKKFLLLAAAALLLLVLFSVLFYAGLGSPRSGNTTTLDSASVSGNAATGVCVSEIQLRLPADVTTREAREAWAEEWLSGPDGKAFLEGAVKTIAQRRKTSDDSYALGILLQDPEGHPVLSLSTEPYPITDRTAAIIAAGAISWHTEVPDPVPKPQESAAK